MSQRVVMVGATGHIGRPLCRELMRTGHDVIVFSRDPADSQSDRISGGRSGSLGAGDGNRTRTASLEGWDSTIELHPRRRCFTQPVRPVQPRG
jgi:uncharacterized protein YbjT (DUF2867 family)